MHQFLQIFRKDLRHFWHEALLCVLVTATFARLYPAQWVDAESTRIFFLGLTLPAPTVQTLTKIVVALVPISCPLSTIHEALRSSLFVIPEGNLRLLWPLPVLHAISKTAPNPQSTPS